MIGRVVTFGEIMMRLSPPSHLRLVQADSLQVTYGGGEANVAVSLANYGCDSFFVSRLPGNPLGQAAANHLRRYGVQVQYISWGGDRIGIYFAENGSSQRPSLVVYDRAHAAVAELRAGEIPWREVFAAKDWFHFTGITPALGDGPAETTLEAVRIAKDMGLTVSCDLNYRKKLWSREKANITMSGLMEHVDVVFGNEEDAESIFGIRAEGSDIEGGKLAEDSYRQVAIQLAKRFKFKYTAITLRESHSASDNSWSALLYDGQRFYTSDKYKIHVVDRIGAGDSFCGALIYAFLANYALQKAVDFATAASCLKHTIPGDFNHVTLAEVEALAAGDASGRVQR